MKDVMRLCRPARFSVRSIVGVRDVDGWSHGAWAVHEWEPGAFGLTILPLGLSLPLEWASFPKRNRAVAAMVAIARLRNDWAIITQADLNAELEAKLRVICKRFGAVEGPVQLGIAADNGLLGLQAARTRNGFDQVAA